MRPDPDDDKFDLAIVVALGQIPRPFFDYGSPLGEAVGEFDNIYSQLAVMGKFSEFVEPVSIKADGGLFSYALFLYARLWRLAKKIARLETTAVGCEDRDGGTRRFLRTWAEEYGNLRERMVGAYEESSPIKDDPVWHLELFEDSLERICLAWEGKIAEGTAK